MKLSISDVRQYYPADDPVHGFSHVLRVYRLCQRIGSAEGADLRILGAAALLHDVDGDVDVREEHQLAAARFAASLLSKQGWDQESIDRVAHCIRAHRFRDDREEPRSLEARVLFDADKLDAIGAVGVARAVAYAVRAGMDVFAVPSSQFLQNGNLEPGESQTVAHEYLFKLRHIKDRLYTETGRSLAEKRHRLMEDFFHNWLEELSEESNNNPADQDPLSSS
jgi:uncharacterized protein